VVNKSARLRRILRAPPGGTHTSSADRAPHLRERLVAGNRLDPAFTNLVATAPGLRGPELINPVGLGGIQTLYEAVGQKRARLAGQSESLLRNLIHRHRHGMKIRHRLIILKRLLRE